MKIISSGQDMTGWMKMISLQHLQTGRILMPKNKKEFREELTRQFLSLIEKENLEWIREWSSLPCTPVNGFSGKSYTGINHFKLLLTMLQNGWTDPRFMTFSQAGKIQKAGSEEMCNVARGAKGFQIEYWFLNDLKKAYGQKGKFLTFQEAKKLTDKGLREADDFQLSARYYTVFHATQISGIPAYESERDHNPIVTQDEIVDRISSSMGVGIDYNDGDMCFYRPSEDKIYLPKPEYFKTQYAFVSSALHELGHSTGSPKRLDRNMKGTFGTKEYAFEELVAEMTSCFISSEIRMPEDDDSEYWDHHLKNHAGYVQSWMEILKSDINALPRAIKLAEQAADYLEMHGGMITRSDYERKYSREIPATLQINNENKIQKEHTAASEMMPSFD